MRRKSESHDPTLVTLFVTCVACSSGGGLILFFLNQVLKIDHSTRFGIKRRPVHNHALVSTADLPGST